MSFPLPVIQFYRGVPYPRGSVWAPGRRCTCTNRDPRREVDHLVDHLVDRHYLSITDQIDSRGVRGQENHTVNCNSLDSLPLELQGFAFAPPPPDLPCPTYSLIPIYSLP